LGSLLNQFKIYAAPPCPIRIARLLNDNGKEFIDRLFASRERESSSGTTNNYRSPH